MILLTPIDIHNKEFKRGFRGYDEDEIDDFLDQVASDYEMLFRENANLKNEIESLKREINLSKQHLDKYHELETNLRDTLMVAQKTAKQVTDNAEKAAKTLSQNTRQECDNLLTNARLESENLRTKTQQECDGMRQEATFDARRTREEAAAKVRDIVSEYDRLVREKRRTIEKMRETFLGEIKLLDEAARNLPDPDIAVPQGTRDSVESVQEPESESEPMAKAKEESATEQEKTAEEQPPMPDLSDDVSPEQRLAALMKQVESMSSNAFAVPPETEKADDGEEKKEAEEPKENVSSTVEEATKVIETDKIAAAIADSEKSEEAKRPAHLAIGVSEQERESLRMEPHDLPEDSASESDSAAPRPRRMRPVEPFQPVDLAKAQEAKQAPDEK